MTRSAVAMVLTVLAAATVFAAETNDVMLQIERMVSAGEKSDRALGESIIDGIEKNPTDVSKVLVHRLNDKNLTEQQQAVYVWALGLSKDQKTVGQIEALHGRSKSELVRRNCLRALVAIGGRQAEAFLVATLDATTDKEMRFNILNLLGQMQSEAALPKAKKSSSWRSRNSTGNPFSSSGKWETRRRPSY